MAFIALPCSAWLTKDVSPGNCITKQEAVHAESTAKRDIKIGISTVKLLLDKPDQVSLQYVGNDAKTTSLLVLTLTVCAQFQFQSQFLHGGPARIHTQ